MKRSTVYAVTLIALLLGAFAAIKLIDLLLVLVFGA